MTVQRAAQPERDMAIYRAHVDGAPYATLADRYEVTVGAISQAIARVQSALPAPEKAQEIRRAVDLCDDMLATYVPGARDLKPAHSREARGWLQLKAKWLGIDRREVEHTGDFQVHHTWEPGPTVAEVLNDWRQQGIIKGEITRADR